MTPRSKRRAELAARIAAAEKALAPRVDYSRDPVGYIRDVLKVDYITPVQQRICQLLQEPPCRVAAKSGHNVGKTFIEAAILNWWYDTFDPGVVISTAPTWQGVKDVLWAEVRLQRLRAGLTGGFRGEMMPYLYSSWDHWAQGITANPSSAGAAFAGRHRARMLFIFDEAIGVKPIFFEVMETMFMSDSGHAVIATYNPTDPSSRMYFEERSRTLDERPKWHIVEMSSLDHPNVLAQLRGEPKTIPTAVDLEQVETGIADECDPVQPGDEDDDLDFFWPPPGTPGRESVRYRPGPVFEARWQGKWPSGSVFGVWSEYRWKLACEPRSLLRDPAVLPVVGCDVAAHGDDHTAIACRHGGTALRFERHSGWDHTQTAPRIMGLCRELADYLNRLREPGARPVEPERIPINVDDAGIGHALVGELRKEGFTVRGCHPQSPTSFPQLYDELRDELWFALVQKARKKLVDLSGLGKKTLEQLRVEAMAPLWGQTSAGRRKVEPKKIMKKRLGYSPDSMDALNLSFWDAPLDAPVVLPCEDHALGERPVDQSGAKRRGWID